MKKLGLFVRGKIAQSLKERVDNSNACFFVGFNKMNAFAINRMRNNLKNAGAGMMVTKNALLERVFNELGRGSLNGFLSQETGIIIVEDEDIVKTCKTIVDFSKENETLQIRGGFLKDKKINAEGVTALAKLPAKEVLLAMAVSGIASPLTGFVSTLNQVILKFVLTVEAIKKSKEKN